MAEQCSALRPATSERTSALFRNQPASAVAEVCTSQPYSLRTDFPAHDRPDFMVTKIFLTAIALVVPVFFVSLFVMSTYNRLSALRRRCADLAAKAETTNEPARDSQLRSEHAAAVEAYHRARSAFPASVLGALLRFPRTIASLAAVEMR